MKEMNVLDCMQEDVNLLTTHPLCLNIFPPCGTRAAREERLRQLPGDAEGIDISEESGNPTNAEATAEDVEVGGWVSSLFDSPCLCATERVGPFSHIVCVCRLSPVLKQR